MEEKYKVSMVVAIYNSELFLPKLIDSIMNQTYHNIEVILVDDGSPDNSGKICDEYAARDSRIKVIHKRNGGTCDARNVGIDSATGDYLVIIDGDDWLELDFVEYLMRLVFETKSDMALTDKIFTTRNRSQTTNDYTEVWSSEKATAAIIYPYMEIGPWNKIYSMKMLNEHNLRFSVKWSGEGLYFASMAAQFSNHVGVGHKKIYNYRLNNSGSGLTHYNVQMGINALENIKLINSLILNRSTIVEDAIDWHIWKNHYYVMFLIIATNGESENNKLYEQCKKYIRHNALRVTIKSEVGKKEKIRMILKSVFPKRYALYEANKRRKALEKDKIE